MSTAPWKIAEQIAVQHMQSIGYLDAQLTGSGADAGIDVVSSAAVAQVKLLAKPVGAPDIQRFRGASHDMSHALFYSWSGYTRAALVAADSTGIALFVVDSAGAATAANLHATDLRPPEPESENDRLRQRLRAELAGPLLRAGAWKWILDEKVEWRRANSEGSPNLILNEMPEGRRAEAERRLDELRSAAAVQVRRVLDIEHVIADSKHAETVDRIGAAYNAPAAHDIYDVRRPDVREALRALGDVDRDTLAHGRALAQFAPYPAVHERVMDMARGRVRSDPERYGKDPSVARLPTVP